MGKHRFSSLSQSMEQQRGSSPFLLLGRAFWVGAIAGYAAGAAPMGLHVRLPFRGPAAEIPAKRRENIHGFGRCAKPGRGELGTCRVEVTLDRLSSLHMETKTLGMMTRDILGQSKNLL